MNIGKSLLIAAMLLIGMPTGFESKAEAQIANSPGLVLNWARSHPWLTTIVALTAIAVPIALVSGNDTAITTDTDLANAISKAALTPGMTDGELKTEIARLIGLFNPPSTVDKNIAIANVLTSVAVGLTATNTSSSLLGTIMVAAIDASKNTSTEMQMVVGAAANNVANTIASRNPTAPAAGAIAAAVDKAGGAVEGTYAASTGTNAPGVGAVPNPGNLPVTPSTNQMATITSGITATITKTRNDVANTSAAIGAPSNAPAPTEVKVLLLVEPNPCIAGASPAC